MMGRYIPSGYTEKVEGADAVVYHDGDRYAIAYHGRAQRHDWHRSFPSAERREEYIREFIKRRQAHLDRVAERRRQAGELANTVKVGDIFSYSWGWEQTQVEFWEVVEVLPKSIRVREIAYGERWGTGGMSESVKPAPGVFLNGPTLTKRLTAGYGEPLIRFAHGVGVLTSKDRAHHHSWYG